MVVESCEESTDIERALVRMTGLCDRRSKTSNPGEEAFSPEGKLYMTARSEGSFGNIPMEGIGLLDMKSWGRMK
jgi:hypothetical protein